MILLTLTNYVFSKTVLYFEHKLWFLCLQKFCLYAFTNLYVIWILQIIGFMIAVVFFALMRQARAWELDLTLPSILTATEFNLRMPFPFLLLAVLPTIFSLVLSVLTAETLPPVISFLCVSIACFLIANGSVIIVILSSQLVLYMAASLHVFMKKWSVQILLTAIS